MAHAQRLSRAETATSAAPGAAADVGLIYNPRSHRNRALGESAAGLPGVVVAAPERRGDLRSVLEDFARRKVRCIAISGGDGTVRDVLTAGLPIFGDTWPELAVIPAGKTNALNVDLGAPKDWTLPGLVDALEKGRRVIRRPMIVRGLDNGDEVVGFVFGAGVFTTAIAAGQDAHRLGAFDSIAVGATAAWGVAQALFGTDRNRWRRGAPIAIRTGAERTPLPRTRWGDPGRRMFVLAATLERYPMGVRPFGDLAGLKLAVLDQPRRRVMALIPAIAAGWSADWLTRNGVHRCATDRIEFDLGDRFILDGEAFPAGRYEVVAGPELSFVIP